MPRTQYVGNVWRQQVHEWISQAEHMPISDSPSKNAAENVAPASVRRQDAVAYERYCSAGVVGNDLHISGIKIRAAV
jgi:hypothetical protein